MLTRKTFAPKVLAALRAKRTFHNVTVLTTADDSSVVTSDVRIRPDGRFDFKATLGKTVLVRIGEASYLKDAGVTKDPARPWAKLDLDSDDFSLAFLAALVDLLASQASPHQVLGATAYAKTFEQRGATGLDGVPAHEYDITVDVRKGLAAKAFGDYLDSDDLPGLSGGLAMRVAVDGDNLPRSIDFTGVDGVWVDATLSRFGQKVAIAAPPPALIGPIRKKG